MPRLNSLTSFGTKSFFGRYRAAQGGGGQAANPELSEVLLTVTGQYSTTSYSSHTVDLSDYVGSTGRLVMWYETGTSYTGDLQIDNVSLNGTTYNFASDAQNWQTTTTDVNTTSATTSHYNSLSFSNVATGTSGLRFNRDASGTGSSGTGLTFGTNGSWYLYAETSGSGWPWSMWLRSPEVTLTTGSCSFDLGRYGATIGTARFYWFGTPTALYDFTSFTFTSGNTYGYLGPSKNTLISSYNTTSNPWLNNTSYYDSASGFQEWTVPESGSYEFVVEGASGGKSRTRSSVFVQGGKGAKLTFRLSLTRGDVLKLLVGQRGVNNDSTSRGAGGGGGSYVYNSTSSTLLAAAGGGGGAGDYDAQTPNYMDANHSGTAGYSGYYQTNYNYSSTSVYQTVGSGGTNGNGGGAGFYSSGGAGWSSDGSDASYTLGGHRFLASTNAGWGGGHYNKVYTNNSDTNSSAGTNGGFGGGAGSYAGGGGGGGYSGGGGGAWSYAGAGGGGGSYVISSATNKSTTLASSNGTNGSIKITQL